MSIDPYGAFVVAERGVAFVMALTMWHRAKHHEPEVTFDYRRRAAFAYAINATLIGSLLVSGINVAIPGSDVFLSRVAIAFGTAVVIVGYGLLLLGWPGPRRAAPLLTDDTLWKEEDA